MQSRKHTAFRERTLLYWAKTYSAQLAPGDRYDELRPVISILILDFIELRGTRLHSRFELLETHELERFSDNLELHVLELPKLAHARAAELAAEPGVLSWSKFFSANSDEQREALAMADPGIDKAKKILERLSADPLAREAARIRERAEINVKLMNAAERRAGREEGLAEGRQEGLAEGRQEGLAEGRQEGLAEGRQEGLAEGLLSAARTAVLDVLEARGIPLSDAARQRIEASCDLAQLHAWHRAAIRVASVDALWT
jgi:predicted transposase/invertase (TIGR01784 family)